MQQKLFKGKIISFIGGLATVRLINDEIIKCRPRGIFRYDDKLLKPIVGDNVLIEHQNDTYLICKIKERKNVLIRPKVANIDEVIIIQSVIEPSLNTLLLNKYLAHYEARVDKVSICFTKLDLLKKTDDIEFFNKIYTGYINDGYNIYLSNSNADLEKIKYSLSSNVICLVGKSGVGKSTLLTKLVPNLQLRTQEISKFLNSGKHTTTNSILIPFNQGNFVDTPGFSTIELYLDSIQLANSYHDFNKYSTMCKYRNCLHDNENGCYVKKMIKEQKIAFFRYNDYLKLLKQTNK